MLEAEWKTTEKALIFLKATASITKQQPGWHFVTFRRSMMLFKNLRVTFDSKMDGEDLHSLDVARKRLTMLRNYTSWIDNSLSNLALILDQMFWNDFISDDDIFCNLRPLPVYLSGCMFEKAVHVEQKSFL